MDPTGAISRPRNDPPPPPILSTCPDSRRDQPDPRAEAEPIEILIDARTATRADRVSRDQIAKEVRHAEKQLARICGGAVGAEQREELWLALDDDTRVILRELEMVYAARSLLPADSRTRAAMALGLLTNTKNPTVISSDQICRLYWVHGVQTAVAPFRGEANMQTPLDFLQAVYRLTNTPFTLAVDGRLRLRADIDPERVAAARMLFEQKQYPDSTPVFSDMAAEQRFRLRLDEDLAETLRTHDIIPYAAPNYHYGERGIWHDGLALRGAVGMDADALSRQLQRKHTPKSDADRLIQRRMRELGESGDYVIGTPHQSMASIVLKLGPAFGLSTEGLGDPGCLLETFKALIDLVAASEKYPIDPLLMAARHCARASGVLDSVHLTEEELLARETRTLLQAGTLEWRENPEGENPAHSFNWKHLPAMDRAGRPLTDSAFERLALKQYRHLKKTRKTLVKRTMPDLNAATLAWFKERLSAYLPVPLFDMAQAAYDVLATDFGMNKTEIETVRPYRFSKSYVDGNGSGRHQTMRRGSWVDEFLARAELDADMDRKMIVGSKVIDTRNALAVARQRYKADLANSPLLRAKAKETLRLTDRSPTDSAIAKIATGIADAVLAKGKAYASSLGETIPAILRILETPHIADPLIGVFDAVASGHPERIIDEVPFLGPAYQIEQGLWRQNWTETAMGVARLGKDVLFTWVFNMPEREAAQTVANILDNTNGTLFDLPAVSGLKDYLRDTNPVGTGLEPRGTGEYEGVGEADNFELSYSEAGAGADNEGRLLTGMPLQFGDRPLSADSAGLWRTLVDCQLFFGVVATPGDARAPANLDCGWRFCASANGAAGGRSGTGDPFVTVWPESQAHLDEVRRSFGATPTWQSLVAHSHYVGNTDPMSIVFGGDAAPITIFKHRDIVMPEDAALLSKKYIGPLGPETFTISEVYLHELVHGLTLLRDNVGYFPWLHRGPILPICDQIIYESVTEESKALSVPRIVYQRYIAPEESQFRHDQALIAKPGALAQTLAENVELDALFAERNAEAPHYTILGASAAERVTVTQGSRLVKKILKIANDRPGNYRVALAFADLAKVDAGTTEQAFVLQTEVVLMFDRLCRSSNLFLIAAERLLVDMNARAWIFDFNKSWGGREPQAWKVDRQARTVYFNGCTLFYLSRGGPQKLSLERSFVNWVGSEINDDGRSVPTFDARFNRGSQVLWENLVFAETGTVAQRVSAELAENPDDLWSRASSASKAASDEDIRLKRIVKPLDFTLLAKLRSAPQEE